jgi:hypothetical protein
MKADSGRVDDMMTNLDIDQTPRERTDTPVAMVEHAGAAESAKKGLRGLRLRIGSEDSSAMTLAGFNSAL